MECDGEKMTVTLAEKGSFDKIHLIKDGEGGLAHTFNANCLFLKIK